MLRAFGASRPVVAPSAFVDSSAQVIGDVAIGDESSVWMNVVIRGDVHRIRWDAARTSRTERLSTSCGTGYPTTIGDEVTVGHGALLHGCTVDDRVLVGMGAIVLNGVTIGQESIVAAGTLVAEGTEFPPRSLVMGTPGRVRRELTDDEVQSIRDYATRYVGYRLDYLGQPAD